MMQREASKQKIKEHGLDELSKAIPNVNEFINVNYKVHTIFSTLILNFKYMNGASIVGDKFPWYVSFIEDMLEMFPDAKYIYSVRHPCAV